MAALGEMSFCSITGPYSFMYLSTINCLRLTAGVSKAQTFSTSARTLGGSLATAPGDTAWSFLRLLVLDSANCGLYTPLSPTLRLISRNIVVRSTFRISAISLKFFPSCRSSAIFCRCFEFNCLPIVNAKSVKRVRISSSPLFFVH